MPLFFLYSIISWRQIVFLKKTDSTILCNKIYFRNLIFSKCKYLERNDTFILKIFYRIFREK